jgi:hypothetical protein
VVLYGFFIVVIVPPVARNLGEMVVQMAAQQQIPMAAPKTAMPDAALFARIYTVMYSVMGVGMAALGSVYPLIVLWLLTRPGVKSACAGVYKLPPEPNQPW